MHLLPALGFSFQPFKQYTLFVKEVLHKSRITSVGKRGKLSAFFLLLRPDEATLGSVWPHSPGGSLVGGVQGPAGPRGSRGRSAAILERVQCCRTGEGAVLQTWERMQCCSACESAVLQTWESVQCCRAGEGAVLQRWRGCSAADLPPVPPAVSLPRLQCQCWPLFASGPAAETNQSHKPLRQCVGKGRTERALCWNKLSSLLRNKAWKRLVLIRVLN